MYYVYRQTEKSKALISTTYDQNKGKKQILEQKIMCKTKKQKQWQFKRGKNKKKIQHTQNVFSTVNGFIFIKLNSIEKKSNKIKWKKNYAV